MKTRVNTEDLPGKFHGGDADSTDMNRAELEQLGIWERQVELSKLWERLVTPVYRVKDEKGVSPSKARVRKTEWMDCWLYMDEEGYQLLDDTDVRRWVLGS